MTATVDFAGGSVPASGNRITQFEAAFSEQRRRARLFWLIGTAVFVCAFGLTAWIGDFFKVTQVTMPDGSREWRWIIPAGIPRLGEYVSKTIPTLRWETLGTDLANWFWRWRIWLELLFETILIAYMATVLGVIGGFVLSFPAARNLSPNKWVFWITRRYLEIARTVPELVWALIFVFCFSVGPMAGVMAIGLHATGALGKLYSEVNENIDMRPLEGVKAAGGTWFDQIRYGAVPQVLPNIVSYTFALRDQRARVVDHRICRCGWSGSGIPHRDELSGIHRSFGAFRHHLRDRDGHRLRLGKTAAPHYRNGGPAMTMTPDQIASARTRMPLAFQAPLEVRLRRTALWVFFISLFIWCLYDFNITPARIWEGLARFGTVASFMFPPHVWDNWESFSEILNGLGETLAIAFLGTVLGAVFAFPLSFLGAKNINRLNVLRLGTRRGYDIIRAFETLILALIFIRAFGLGPLPGILAIAVSEIGTFAKLFSEAIENTSEKPVEGVKASGGSRLQQIRFGVMPQVNPVILSILLYNFESNVRSGTILGIVGAGGIGFLLSDRIAAYKWDEAWSIIFLIIAMVYVIDWLSGLIRAKLIGKTDLAK